jgi:pyruvate/2-oxoglutarate dehydrogenase complex dihydrolipoamide dehydrogenase (E3) component
MEQFDAIIIGTGQAGPALAVRLTESEYRVAIIERHLFYGTCVNTGCIPTKTMLASAKAAHMARHAADYGLTVNGDVRVDMKQIKARKDDIVGTANDQIPQWMTDLPNLTVYKGHARFEDARTVRVGDGHLSADRIFINVGARAFVPQLPGLSEVDYLTNADMMRLEELPAHLVIIGGSYVGLEFAQMFRRFGSEVTVIEKGPRLIGREDKDVSDAVHDILAGEGVNIRLNAECIGVGKKEDGIYVQLYCRSGAKEVNGSHLLVAVGRRPNTDDLGCEKAGLEVNERGYIVVNDQLRTSVAGIWALGDCNGQGAFTHTAYNDSEIVAANLLDDDPRRMTDRIPTYALYTDPPLGRVGMTEQQVRDSGRKALVGKRPMERVNRAKAKGDTRGFIKVVVDAETEKILGAAILGVGGDEAVHLLTDTMYADVSYKVVQRAVHIHPTVSELVPTVLGQLEPLE